jgi:3'(2'), 5'-bisphosphate nucleotidase
VVVIPEFAKTSHFQLLDLIEVAGKAIMDVFNTDFSVEHKQDSSPITKADLAANKIITDALKKTNIQIISEENDIPSFEQRKKWKEFWIIDPLDGTKEFVKKGNDFTVNIARIVNEAPVEGYIYVPATKTFYWGENEIGAFKYSEEYGFQTLPIYSDAKNIIVASKSHYNEETNSFLNNIYKALPGISKVNIGSSLKFCLIAEGEAMLYPRLGSINEWDIAAGDAIVRASGSFTISLLTGKQLIYNSKSLKTPDYVAGTNIDILNKISEIYKKNLSN